MEVRISKFEEYPEDTPTGYAVGFKIISTTGRSFYLDTVIPFITPEPEEEVYLKAAWSKVKIEANERIALLNKKKKIVGAKWSPDLEDIEDEQI